MSENEHVFLVMQRHMSEAVDGSRSSELSVRGVFENESDAESFAENAGFSDSSMWVERHELQ